MRAVSNQQPLADIAVRGVELLQPLHNFLRLRKGAKKMDELNQLKRWCRGAGHYATIDIIERWQSMSAEDRASLSRRWAKEDADRLVELERAGRRRAAMEARTGHGTG